MDYTKVRFANVALCICAGSGAGSGMQSSVGGPLTGFCKIMNNKLLLNPKSIKTIILFGIWNRKICITKMLQHLMPSWLLQLVHFRTLKGLQA